MQRFFTGLIVLILAVPLWGQKIETATPIRDRVVPTAAHLTQIRGARSRSPSAGDLPRSAPSANSAQLLKLPKLRHLTLGLAQSRRTGKRLGHGLAFDLAREAEMRPVAGVAGLGAMTVGLSTTPHDLEDGAGTKIT